MPELGLEELPPLIYQLLLYATKVGAVPRMLPEPTAAV